METAIERLRKVLSEIGSETDNVDQILVDNKMHLKIVKCEGYSKKPTFDLKEYNLKYGSRK